MYFISMNTNIMVKSIKCSLKHINILFLKKEIFRIKIKIFSNKNKVINTQRFYYLIKNKIQDNVYFPLININLSKNSKILINIKSLSGFEAERIIYFEEVNFNDGNINL